jgi:hypothetical protein
MMVGPPSTIDEIKKRSTPNANFLVRMNTKCKHQKCGPTKCKHQKCGPTIVTVRPNDCRNVDGAGARFRARPPVLPSLGLVTSQTLLLRLIRQQAVARRRQVDAPVLVADRGVEAQKRDLMKDLLHRVIAIKRFFKCLLLSELV